MKHATEKQIIEAAKFYGNVGHDSTYGMYCITFDGIKKYFGRKLYRDSLHGMAQRGILKANGDWTYSLAS